MDIEMCKKFEDYFDIVKKLKNDLFSKNSEYGKPSYYKGILNKYVKSMFSDVNINDETKKDIIKYFIKVNDTLFSLVSRDNYNSFNKYITLYVNFLDVYLISRYNNIKIDPLDVLNGISVKLSIYFSDLNKFDILYGLNYSDEEKDLNEQFKDKFGEELFKLKKYNDDFIYFIEFNLSLIKSNKIAYHEIERYIEEINKIELFLKSYKYLVNNNVFNYNIVNLRRKIYNLFYDFIKNLKEEWGIKEDA